MRKERVVSKFTADLKQAIVYCLAKYDSFQSPLIWKEPSGRWENTSCAKCLRDEYCSEYFHLFELHSLIDEYRRYTGDNLICTNEDVVPFKHDWSFDSLHKIDSGPYLEIRKYTDGTEDFYFIDNQRAEELVNIWKPEKEKQTYLEKNYRNIGDGRSYYTIRILRVDNFYVFKEEIGIIEEEGSEDYLEKVYFSNYRPTGSLIPYKIVNISVDHRLPFDIESLIAKHFKNIDQQFKNAFNKDRMHCDIFSEFCEKLLLEYLVPKYGPESYKKFIRVNRNSLPPL